MDEKQKEIIRKRLKARIIKVEKSIDKLYSSEHCALIWKELNDLQDNFKLLKDMLIIKK